MISGRFFEEVFVKEIYKPVRELGQIKTIIDCGATTGEFSLWVYPQAEVIYAVEPQWEAFNHLAENVRDLPKITPFYLAIAGENGHRGVYNKEIGTSRIDVTEGEGIFNVVKSLTLASFMNENNISFVDCLKIDVESAEKEIFQATDFPEAAKKIKYIIGEPHNHAEEIGIALRQNDYEISNYDHGYIARRTNE